MRFDTIHPTAPSKKHHGDAKPKSDHLVCVDIQQGAPIDKMPVLELADFVRGYKQVVWMLDKIQCEEARVPDVIMEAWGNEIPANIRIVEKEYGGMLHFALEYGYAEEAISFFSEVLSGAPREKIELKHSGFLEAMGAEMNDTPDRIWHRMQVVSDELITGIDRDMVEAIGKHTDICGGAIGECLSEVEMMLEAHGITTHVITRFIY